MAATSATPARKLTADELSKFDGVQSDKVYIAVKGRVLQPSVATLATMAVSFSVGNAANAGVVFDVSGAPFYRPDGGYGLFAGHDCSRSLGTSRWLTQAPAGLA